jgi:hypothetical protein
MQIITIYDFILLPLYLAIFYFFIKRKAATYTNTDIKKIFIVAFFLHMFGSVAYSLLVQYYYGYGDSFVYYKGGDFFNTELIKNPGNIKYFFAPPSQLQEWFIADGIDDLGIVNYFVIPSSTAVMKISALLSFFAFNKFIIISLFFGLFSFAGQWKLFQVFNDYNKGKSQNLLAYAVLYSPSIWFWGSGLMKDSICLGAMGFIIHILYKNIVKKEIVFKEWLLLLLLIFIIYIIKSYIIMILFASIMTVIFVRYVLQLKNLAVRFAVIILFLISSALFVTFSNFSAELNDIVQESYVQVQTFQQNYQNSRQEDENSKAGFDIGNFDASLTSMVIKSPSVIFSCLFRPFLWESKKIIILFTALESTLLLLCTLYLLFITRFRGFFKIIFSNPFVLFAFVIAILFALIIGFTTFNFGTMTRYKIILLPFYYFILVHIYIKAMENKIK